MVFGSTCRIEALDGRPIAPASNSTIRELWDLSVAGPSKGYVSSQN